MSIPEISPLPSLNQAIPISPELAPARSGNSSTDTLASAKAIESLGCFSCISSIVDTITYPLRYALCVLARYTIFRIVIFPFELVYNMIMRTFDTIYYFAAKRFQAPEIPFSQEQLENMQEIYWRLGADKWKEGMEMHFHQYGAYVFDKGLGTGGVEFGFHRNWNRAVHFLSHQFQQKMDAKLYLQLHRTACSHFLLGANDTLTERAGVFRDINSSICWTCKGSYIPTAEALQELDGMNREIQERFAVQLAKFVANSDGSMTLEYTKMSQEKIEAIYNYFSMNLYAALERAQNPDQKLRAICAFFRNCEWLHSVHDGCGRCDLMTLNFLLTQQGFHPVIMDYPYLASTISLANWITYVQNGLRNWEALRDC